MAKDLGITKLTDIDPSQDIIAGDHPLVEVSDITIAAGNKFTRGTCLGKVEESGEYAGWNEDSDDGTEDLVGILGCDVDATEAAEKGFMYVHGEFEVSALIAFVGTTVINPINPIVGIHNDGVIIFKEAKE
jgi:hypothetical protein